VCLSLCLCVSVSVSVSVSVCLSVSLSRVHTLTHTERERERERNRDREEKRQTQREGNNLDQKALEKWKGVGREAPVFCVQPHHFEGLDPSNGSLPSALVAALAAETQYL